MLFSGTHASVHHLPPQLACSILLGSYLHRAPSIGNISYNKAQWQRADGLGGKRSFFFPPLLSFSFSSLHTTLVSASLCQRGESAARGRVGARSWSGTSPPASIVQVCPSIRFTSLHFLLCEVEQIKPWCMLWVFGSDRVFNLLNFDSPAKIVWVLAAWLIQICALTVQSCSLALACPKPKVPQRESFHTSLSQSRWEKHLLVCNA